MIPLISDRIIRSDIWKVDKSDGFNNQISVELLDRIWTNPIHLQSKQLQAG